MMFFTPLTHIFTDTMIKDNVKPKRIVQALTQAVQTRSIIAPILFVIGVAINDTFGSKWLIDHLYQLGFSISYYEVSLFK